MRKKTDAVADITSRANLPKSTVEAVLSAQRDSIHQALVDDGEYQIHDIGVLKTTERAARKGRNPQTGESIDIAASTSVTFKVSKPLKDVVQQ